MGIYDSTMSIYNTKMFGALNPVTLTVLVQLQMYLAVNTRSSQVLYFPYFCDLVLLVGN